ERSEGDQSARIDDPSLEVVEDQRNTLRRDERRRSLGPDDREIFPEDPVWLEPVYRTNMDSRLDKPPPHPAHLDSLEERRLDPYRVNDDVGPEPLGDLHHLVQRGRGVERPFAIR